MAIGQFAVLLRNGTHTQWRAAGGWGSGTPARYGIALKCDNVAVSYAKTPIQIPIPQNSPEIIDLGIFRPSITLSGLIESVSTNTTVSPYMESITVASKSSDDANAGTAATSTSYYLPYKNILENIMMSWITTSNVEIELQLGNADHPYQISSTAHTGGAIYKIALQQCRFQQNAAQEDRWQFSLQAVAKARDDFVF